MGSNQATTSIFIDKYHPKSDKTCSISIRVTHNRKKKYYPIPFSLTEADFLKTQSYKPREPFKDISLQLQAFEKKAADIIKQLPVFSWRTFEKQYLSNKGAKDEISNAFKEYSSELRKAGRIGTAVSYECAKNSICHFDPMVKFADITPEFLHKYEKWMLSKGNSITTVGIYLRSLRTLFNNAILDGILTKDFYPFGKKKYEIPTGNNIKKALNIKEIAAIFSYQSEPGSIRERMKEYWKFMYLCNGINVKDMCLLKYSNIKGDILEFERAKTSRTKRKVEAIRVIISKDVKQILKKIGNTDTNPNNYIFPVLKPGLDPVTERQKIQQFTHLLNSHMKEIAKDLGITSTLTSYTARHSFSTILQRSGASISFISTALGHSDVRTTQNYLGGFEDESKKEIIKALTDF